MKYTLIIACILSASCGTVHCMDNQQKLINQNAYFTPIPSEPSTAFIDVEQQGGLQAEQVRNVRQQITWKKLCCEATTWCLVMGTVITGIVYSVSK